MLTKLDAKWAKTNNGWDINMRDIQWIRDNVGLAHELRWDGDGFPFEPSQLEFHPWLERLLETCESLVEGGVMRSGLEELYIVAVAGFKLGQKAARES